MEQLNSDVPLRISHRENDKINLIGYCIICLNEQGISPEVKENLVESIPSFLNTFNEIWKVLVSSCNSKSNENEGPSSPKVSMESVLLEGSKGKFSETPTLCQLCYDKIVVVDNLMKDLRRQVNTIKMVLLESRKGERFDRFERALKDTGLEESVIRSTMQIVNIFGGPVSVEGQQPHPNENTKNEVTRINTGQPEPKDNDSQNVQLKEENWHCQELEGSVDQEKIPSQPSASSNAVKIELSNSSTVKSEDNVHDRNAAEDDEDDSNWSWDGDGNNLDIKAEVEDEGDDGDDDSNWSWDENDPDHIKSEEMDESEGDDDDDAADNHEDEELTTDLDDDEQEEFMTLEANQSISVTEKDPLEIPVCSKSKIHNITTTVTTAPKESSSSSSSSSQLSILCDENDCTRKFSTVSALFTHKRNCHPSPAQKLLKLQKIKKIRPVSLPPVSSATPAPPRKLYPCDLEACTQKLLSLESLYRHKMQFHTDLMTQLGKLGPSPKYKVLCSCGRRFQSSKAHHLHMSNNPATHPEFRPQIKKQISSQICDQCGESVKLTNIFEHLSSHLGGSSEYVVKCPNFDQCGHMFTHSKDLHEVHLPKSTKSLGNSCRKKALENKWDLNCETCGFTTGQKRIRLQTHLANEHEMGTLPKNLKCPISGCTKMFAVKQSIYFHLHVHRSSPPITTQLCKYCLDIIKIEEIETHFKSKHGIKEVISCELCPYKFSDKEGFSKHLEEHGLSCDICGATYQDKLRLARHQKKHAGEETWKCHVEECGRIFNKKKNWDYHINVTHGGERPFVCDICGKGFGLKAGLKGHRDTVHLGVKPWECEECGERFGTSGILKNHKLIHTGERPFGCGICGQRFRHKEVLNRHEKGHQKKGKDFRPNGPMKKIRKRIKRKAAQ